MKGKHVVTAFAAVVVGLSKQQSGVLCPNLVLVSPIFKAHVMQAVVLCPL